MTQTLRSQLREELVAVIEKYAGIDLATEQAIDDLIACVDEDQKEDPYNAALSQAEKRQIVNQIESSINYENF